MWLVKILLFALFLVFLVQNNTELVGIWPISDVSSESTMMVGVSVVYLIMFFLGYFCGRFSAWSAYAPLRMQLRRQKKENKVLSREHEKLNIEHEKLNHQFSSLQVETEKNENKRGFSFNQKIKKFFSKPSLEDN